MPVSGLASSVRCRILRQAPQNLANVSLQPCHVRLQLRQRACAFSRDRTVSVASVAWWMKL